MDLDFMSFRYLNESCHRLYAREKIDEVSAMGTAMHGTPKGKDKKNPHPFHMWIEQADGSAASSSNDAADFHAVVGKGI
jgi:hypothetical protein